MARQRKRSNRSHSKITLPIDIITAILLLLPPKVLMKLMCVCKAWKNLISDPNFAKEYLQNSRSEGNNEYLLQLCTNLNNSPSFKLFDITYYEISSEINVPFLPSDINYTIVGSSNGIVCLSHNSDDFDNIICLCNPSIGKFKYITSPPPNVYIETVECIVVGFAFLSELNDYKVIRIVNSVPPSFGFVEDEEISDDDDDYDYFEILLYTLSTNSWKRVEVPPFCWVIISPHYSGDLVNHSIHWMACNIKEETVILSFDFNQEVFKEIALPNYENGKQEVVKFVGAFKGSLSVFISSPLSRTKRGSKYFDLWVMKDYGVVDSWTKMFTIKIDGGISRIFTFTKHDAEIVLQDKKKNVLVYNIDAGAIKYLEIEEDPTNQELKLVTFENSLVLIEEKNEQFDHWEYYNPRIVEEDTDEEGMSYY